MFRVLIVVLVTSIGLLAGALFGLLAGALIAESGHFSCSGIDCGNLVIRTSVPAAAVVGAMLGIAKGVDLTSPKPLSGTR